MADYAGSAVTHSPLYSGGEYLTDINPTDTGIAGTAEVLGMTYITDVTHLEYAETDVSAGVLPAVRDEPVMPRREP